MGDFQVEIEVQRPCKIKTKMMDMQGGVISEIEEKDVLQGTESISFQLEQNLPSGAYFLSIETTFGNFTRKIILNR